jgi:hypothetical protein
MKNCVSTMSSYEPMVVNASFSKEEGRRSELRCRQKVVVEKAGQCLSVTVLYDWGATASVITHKAAVALGLSPTRCPTKKIHSLGEKSHQVKFMYTIPLVARNGDVKAVIAWEVEKIAILPKCCPPKDVDE